MIWTIIMYRNLVSRIVRGYQEDKADDQSKKHAHRKHDVTEMYLPFQHSPIGTPTPTFPRFA